MLNNNPVKRPLVMLKVTLLNTVVYIVRFSVCPVFLSMRRINVQGDPEKIAQNQCS